MELVFISGNAKKVEQLSWYLASPIAHQKIDLPEIQSLSLFEIVGYKAREAYRQVQSPVLVEDTSLVFHAIGRLPGPLIKWFLQELGNDGLCQLLNGFTDRSATAGVMFGLFDGHKLVTFKGYAAGSIASVPRGKQEFGWSPIFIPDGHNKTWGEMSLEEQAETSMRRIALRKLEAYLRKIDNP